MATPDTDRLENLRSKFLQMTSPQEFGQERKENVTIISRNVPPMLARADAAFIILTDALSNTSPERAKIDYAPYAELAKNARELAVNADRLTRADGIRADFAALIASLNFLCRYLNVLSTVSNTEKDFCEPADSICLPCDSNAEIFHEIELALLKNLQEALKKLAPAFLEKRQIFLESLSKADMDRFTHAHKIFSTIYKNKIDGSGHDQTN